MLPSEFWKGRQAEFEKYAKQYSDLRAQWKAAFQRWILWWGTTPSGRNVPQECKDVFNAITRIVIAEFPSSQHTVNMEPWTLWLDYMRIREWGFKVTGHTPCTELEWVRGAKDGKPLIEVRREQKYTTGDEWKKIYRRTESGKLRRLSARELKGKSSDDLQQYYHWLEDGAIEDVFGSSARFCEDLASRAYEAETFASTLPGEIESAPALVSGTSTDPEFWLRAKENFRRLQHLPPQPGEVAHQSHNGLCAIWYLWRDSDKRWSFDNASDAVKVLFRSAAENAAVELGHSGGTSAVFYWLDLLRSEGIFYRPLADGGEIYQVCNASAEYCVKLETAAKLAKRNALSGSRSVEPGQWLVPPEVSKDPSDTESGAQKKLGEKKRGRPQTIPVERKIAAAKVKASGGTNKDAAAVLYQTNYPTDQQKKNVPAILRHHHETSKQLTASPKRRNRTSPSNKARG